MATTRAGLVAKAVKSIRGFHALGARVPRRRSHKADYDRGVVRAEAERRGVSDTTVRLARQFAAAYSPAALDRLCRLVERVQPAQEPGTPVFGKTHVIRLLAVPKPDRAALQERAVRAGWSCRDLEAEIAKRYGPRRNGGRRRKLAKDPAGVLAQLERACETWRRWRDELTRSGDADGGTPEALAALPADVRHSFADVVSAVMKLHVAVIEELRRIQPTREGRSAFVNASRGAADSDPNGRGAR